MGEFLTTQSVMACPHGGQVQASTSNSRTKADGAFVLRSSDTFTISGCPFTLPTGSPHPCVSVKWAVTTTRNKVVSNPVLAKDSMGLCLAGDNVPQGPVQVQQAQTRVKGT